MKFVCPRCGHVLDLEPQAQKATCPKCGLRLNPRLLRTTRLGLQLVADRTGQRVGPFLLTGLLGFGGMGEVYRATDGRNGRTVAVKLLLPQLEVVPELVEGFLAEAELLRSFSHPQVVRLIDEGLADDQRYLVMELVHGVNLGRLLEWERPTTAQAIGLLAQVCSVLSAAHAAGIVHRDLKPSNLMLTPEGVVMVLDFGIAKLMLPEEAKTSTGTVAGTPDYMSPQQRRGEAVDHRADLYALGVLLHFLLTGKTPIGNYQKASELNPDVPRSIDRFIARALREDLAQRFQSAAQMRRALLAIRDRPPAWLNVLGAGLIAAGLAVGAWAGLTMPMNDTVGDVSASAPSAMTGDREGARPEDLMGMSVPEESAREAPAASDVLVAPADGIPVFPVQNEGKTPLRTLGKGESVTRLSSLRDAKGDLWLQVRTADGKTGFVPGRYFEGNR